MSNDVSQLFNAIRRKASGAADELLLLVYDELRRLATSRLAQEQPRQTLQATALVHEAWLRLVGDNEEAQNWEHRGHFFAAAAEAMRRILVENARRKGRLKRGGDQRRQDLDLESIAAPEPREDLEALDIALNKLAGIEPDAVQMVQLRYFAGLTLPQVAEIMMISPRSADRLWAFARAWLRDELQSPDFQ